MVKTALQPKSKLKIFDASRASKIYPRIYKKFENHNFLHLWAEQNLLTRLQDIKRTFPNALQIGSKTSLNFQEKLIKNAGISKLITIDQQSFHKTQQNFMQSDLEMLPIALQSQDLVISNLSLHCINDLPGVLSQIRMILKPDGLLIANLFGGETLFELRAALNHAESIAYEGISPHILPFADKPQMGDLLSRAGLALPVVDSDIAKVTYPNIFKLMHDLRGMGEPNIITQRRKNFTRKNLFMEAQQFYQAHHESDDDNTRIQASFEIISIIGWAPAETQQKPLKPGSAQHRLSDALQTKEEKL